MFRRKFLQLITAVGVAGVTHLYGVASTRTVTVSYQVRGFTCVTCAVGLDTILKRQPGIAESHSTYPEGKVTLTFQPEQITEKTIVGLISEMGFHVNEGPASHG